MGCQASRDVELACHAPYSDEQSQYSLKAAYTDGQEAAVQQDNTKKENSQNDTTASG
ncbi:Hypothetical predicted protein [Mytilus galloprovincialis]|uniref:Uncharacterized protein n=1 Tax=Mytilus galloprovincialis TaxID=29158 RepID=A0A8B6EQ52_MYTGA|nr:Hypothetical predicted protein [Mytilus galloprovincialis]